MPELLVPVLIAAAVVVGGYFLGAVPFGYLVARHRGVDILSHGSRNIGATNVGRVLGRGYGMLVFALDFAKGAVPVGVARLTSDPGVFGSEAVPMLAGLAAFLGHLFPVYLGFRGGKGVATGAGVVAVLVPGPAAVAVVVWLGLVFAFRYISLGSVAAAAALAVARIRLTPQPFVGEAAVVTFFCLVSAVLVILKHRANIARLAAGAENRLRASGFLIGAARTIHVLALGMWFGTGVFFLIVGLTIFHSFETLATTTDRPAWLPVPADLTTEQAARLAGVAVGPLFATYFPIEAVCGWLALGTAIGWARGATGTRLHRARAVILMLAALTVATDWPISEYVGRLRLERYADDPAVSARAKEAFGPWHGLSLLINLGTVSLVTLGMGLAGHLPGAEAVDPEFVVEPVEVKDPAPAGDQGPTSA